VKQVVIDGVEYVPKQAAIAKETLDALADAYALAFGWSVYDPIADTSDHKALREVYDLLSKANDELGFRK
jgi:hypothetical protein